METQAEYKTSPASLFSSHARETPDRLRIVCWTWCEVCMTRTDHEFSGEDAIREFYTCPHCGCRKSFAVR